PLFDAVDIDLDVIGGRKPKEPAEAVHRKPDHALAEDHCDLTSEAISRALKGVEHAAGVCPREVQAAKLDAIAYRDTIGQNPVPEPVGLDIAAERPVACRGRFESGHLDIRPQAGIDREN